MKTKKNIFYSLTAFLTAGALSIASMGSVVAAQTQTQNSHVGHTSNTDSFGELNENELEMAFKIIESIPENALENEQAFEQWKSKNLFVGQSRASIGACAWGITKALAANIFVFSKVAKLKTVIKAAGGAKAVAQTAVKAYKIARNDKNLSRSQAIAEASEAVAVNGGGQAFNLLLEFFSVEGVVTGCFSD